VGVEAEWEHATWKVVVAGDGEVMTDDGVE
jgi:hypothetical protein